MATISYIVNAINNASRTFNDIADSAVKMGAAIDAGTAVAVMALRELRDISADAMMQTRLLGMSEERLKFIQRDVAVSSVDLSLQTRILRDTYDLLDSKLTDVVDHLDAVAAAQRRVGVSAAVASGGGWVAAIKNLFAGPGSWSKLLTSIPGSITALVALAAAVGVLVNALVDLGSVIGPAVFGLGSFAAFAAPTVTSIFSGYTAVTTAQTALANATTKNARKIAEANLDKAWKTLDPGQTGVVKGMIALSNEFGKLAKKFEPDVLKLFNMGLKDANKLLPQFFKIAQASGPSILKFFSQLAKDAASPQFQRFLTMMARDAPHALTVAGTAIFKVGEIVIAVARFIGKAKTDINHWFEDIGGAVNRFGAKMIGSQIDVGKWVANVILDIGKVAAWFWSLPIKIGNALASLKGKLFTIGVQAIEGLIGGISSMGGPLQGIVGKIAGWVLGPLGRLLGIHSPSTVTHAAGARLTAATVNAALVRGTTAAAYGLGEPGPTASASGGPDIAGRLDDIASLLADLCDITAGNPAETAAGITGVLAGRRRASGYRAMYGSQG